MGELKFTKEFLNKFLSLEDFLDVDNIMPVGDPIMNDVVFEMRSQGSILKPFIEHMGELAYERLITLFKFYSENFNLGSQDLH